MFRITCQKLCMLLHFLLFLCLIDHMSFVVLLLVYHDEAKLGRILLKALPYLGL